MASKLRSQWSLPYRRRIERGEAQGLSRSQARGHPRKKLGEKSISALKQESKTRKISVEKLAGTWKVIDKLGSLSEAENVIRSLPIRSRVWVSAHDDDVESVARDSSSSTSGWFTIIPNRIRRLALREVDKLMEGKFFRSLAFIDEYVVRWKQF